jgi:predicted acetyltransferase
MEHHRDDAGEMFHAIHEDATGAQDGYISYRIKLAWTSVVPQRELEVVELIALDARAYRDLWGYCLGVDLVDTISFRRGQVDEPLRWLLADARTFQVRGLSDYLWARLLDVPRALAARDYLSPGDLVFELRDDFLPDNSGRYRLHVEAGRGEVGPADCGTDSTDPALALSVADLGAAYLGGVSFRTLAVAGRVKELRPGAVALADSMFAVEASPYCVTMF